LHNKTKLRYDDASQPLEERRRKLTERFIGGKAPDYLEQNSRILDDYFRESFEQSLVGPRMAIDRNPYAMIALGGYGRQEQCVHSDVDLLFLFHKKVPGAAEALIREVVYPLWDAGLEVGHATRSLKECIAIAADDFEVLTSLLDARFICGMSPLFSEMMTQMRHKIIRRQTKRVLEWLMDTNRQRHQQFGDSSYLLEPNLKEGQGGLRDYHTILWTAHVRSDIKQRRDLEYYGILSHDEYDTMMEALAFIWQVRNRLHHMVGRKCDQLYFEHQIKLAERLNYKKNGGQRPVEIFLGELHGRMEFIKQQHAMVMHELRFPKKSKRRHRSPRETRWAGIVIEKNMLCFTGSEAILNHPLLLLKIFEESARAKIPLSAEAKRLIREFAYLLDGAAGSSTAALTSFERILTAAQTDLNALNDMLQTGLLMRLIPEFGSIVNRIQYNAYHIYPVARHSILTVQALKKFGEAGRDPENRLCEDIYQDLKPHKPLMWAALLHDIGKGATSKDHSLSGARLARGVLTRMGLKNQQIDLIVFLVREHLLLIKTATRRDIHDEETAIACAHKIKTIDRLKMLYLLTVADSISTGPKAWNAWTSTLLRDLFLKVLSILQNGELASGEAMESVRKKKEQVLKSGIAGVARKNLAALMNAMSPRYRLYTPATDMIEHVKLFRQLGSDDFVWKIERSTDSNTRTVTICAPDSPGLFSKIAGVMTLNAIDILDAQVYTWRNNIALDVIAVKPPPDRLFEDQRWVRAQADLTLVLAGKMDLASTLRQRISTYRSVRPTAGSRGHRITVDNHSSSFFTIVEVYTDDFSGLLYVVTDALFRCGLDIWVAKIATYVDQVVDVFYVRDFDGQKMDSDEQEATIARAIEQVLPAKD